MSATLLAVIPLLSLDLTSSDGGLTAGGSPEGQWEWGPIAAGPSGAARAWGTALDGVYRHNEESTLTLELPDLAGAERPVLTVDHWYAVSAGDQAVVEVREALGDWTRVEPAYGYPDDDGFVGGVSSWQTSAFDLAGLGAALEARLRLNTDGSTADDGWFVRGITVVDGDPTPPRITPLQEPQDTQDFTGPYPVRMQVEDDQGVIGVELWWSSGGTATPVSMEAEGDLWYADIPGVPPGTRVRWWVEATDLENLTRHPEDDDASFRAFLGTPGAPQRVDSSRVAQEVGLRWDAPESPHPVLDYRLWQVGSTTPLVVHRADATLPLVPGLPPSVFVTARYAEGESDPSPVTDLGLSIPSLQGVSPALTWPGERVRVAVDVRDLYLADGLTTATLGAGVSVEAVSVDSVTRMHLDVAVSEQAAPGPRELQINGPTGRAIFPDALVVGDAASAPGILSVEPGTLKQGRAASVTFRASEAFAGPVSLDPGAYVRVTGAPQTDGSTVTVELTPTTAAPLGPYTLILDDGQRFWSADVEIEDYVLPVQSSCSHGGGRLSGLWLVLTTLLAVRRRKQLT